MTPEAWTVIGTGIVILIAIAASHRQQRRDMIELRRELRGEILELRGDVNGLRERMARLEGLVDGLRERMARLEGLVDGLREALIGVESARECHGTTRDAG